MSDVVQLKHPIEFGEDVITEIKIEPPTLGALRKVDAAKGEIAKTIAVIAACSDLDPVQVEMIKAPDLEAITEVLGKYLPSDPTTGATS